MLKTCEISDNSCSNGIIIGQRTLKIKSKILQPIPYIYKHVLNCFLLDHSILTFAINTFHTKLVPTL